MSKPSITKYINFRNLHRGNNPELSLINKENRRDSGFSLLELTVAVGVLLVLSIFGFIGYQVQMKNARTGAVESTAEEAYTKASAFLAGSADEDLDEIEEEFNEKNDKVRVEITELPNKGVQVRTFLRSDETITAVRTTPSSTAIVSPGDNDGEDTGNGNGGEDTGNETTPPITTTPLILPDITKAFIPVAKDGCTTDPATVKISNPRINFYNYATSGTTGPAALQLTIDETISTCFRIQVDTNELPIEITDNFVSGRQGTSGPQPNSGWGTSLVRENGNYYIDGIRNGNTFAKGTILSFHLSLENKEFNYKTIDNESINQTEPTIVSDNNGNIYVTFTSEVNYIANWETEVDLSGYLEEGETITVHGSSVTGMNTNTPSGVAYMLDAVAGEKHVYTIKNTANVTALPAAGNSRTVVFQIHNNQ